MERARIRGLNCRAQKSALILLMLWIACGPVSAQEVKPAVNTTCRWQLVDRESGLPVREAQVRIECELVRPPGEFPRTEVVSRSEAKTDSQGFYVFPIDSKGHSTANVFVRIRISHAGYLAKKFSVNAKAVLQSMVDGSRVPEQISSLDPGVEVMGTVTNPDGSPARDVAYVGYAMAGEPSKPARDRTANVHGITDEHGRFQVVLAPVGFGIICVLPRRHSPKSIGFLGIPAKNQFPEIRLENGISIGGRVLDTNGKGVENMQITAQRVSNETPDVTAAIGKSRLPSLIVRNSRTDREGRYAFDPLPSGKYEVVIRADFESERPPVYDGYFVKESVELAHGNQSTDFRATQAATVRVKSIDSGGKATAATTATIMGRYRGGSIFTAGVQQAEGRQLIRVPRGLEDAILMLSKDELMAVKLSNDSTALIVNGQLSLGTIETDINQIEVTRFRPTTVTVTILDDSNKKLDDAVPTGIIKSPSPGQHIPVTFRRAENGQWKSTALLPDVPVEIQISKPGWYAKKETLTLKEGEPQAISIVMKKLE